MRPATLIVLLALAAACGKKSEAPPAKVEEPSLAAAPSEGDVVQESPSVLPDGFPMLKTDFSGVYEMRFGGRTVEVTMRGAGDRQRVEFPPGSVLGRANDSWRQIMMTEGAGERIVMWPEGEGAAPTAMQITRKDVGDIASAFGADATARASAVKSGSDKIAGLDCDKWTFGDSDAPMTACVTRDGVTLSVVNGADTVLLAKSIDMARQDPALFAPPSDYEIVDAGECMRVSAEMVAAMQSGKRPDIDLGKLAKCQEVMQKMSAMVGGQ